MIEGRQEYGDKDNDEEPVGKPTERGQTLFLFGTLWIEMTDGLESLEKTLNLSFVLGTEKLIPRRRQLAGDLNRPAELPPKIDDTEFRRSGHPWRNA